MFAIRNKKTKQWVYGTDYTHPHPRKEARGNPRRTVSYSQFTSFERALTYDEYKWAAFDFDSRGCGKDYEIVPVKLTVLEGFNNQ